MVRAKRVKQLTSIFILCVFILFFAVVGAVRAERLPIRIYTTADGVWSTSITYLMRDSRGFIWFCMRDGLSRFDGYRFVNYRMGTGSSYPTHILETRAGVYWITLNGGGLYRYDPNGPHSDASATQPGAASDDGRRVLNAERISQKDFATLLEDRDGNLWAGGADGLALIHDGSGQILLNPIKIDPPEERSQPSLYVFAIAQGHDNGLWLGTNHGLVRRLSDGRVVRFTTRGERELDSVRTLLADKDGRIWIGANLGGASSKNPELCVLKPEPIDALAASGSFTSRPLKTRKPGPRDSLLPLPEAPGEAVDYAGVEALNFATQRKSILASAGPGVSGLLQTSDGRVWLSLTNALAVFDAQRFQTYTAAHGLPGAVFGSLAEDNDGSLWVATAVGPVRLSPKGFVTYGVDDGLSDPYIESIYEDRDGVLHAVNANWFISRLDGRGFDSFRPNLPPETLAGWTSNVGFLDRAGQWWFLTYNGLYRFAPVHRLEDLQWRRPAAVYTQRNGLKSSYLYCMFEDSAGDLWISTGGGDSLSGLTCWRRSSETFHTFTEADGLPSAKSASSFAEDRAGQLWFGFYQGGLARYAAGRFTAFTPEDGSPDGFITGLHLDQAGRLWVASSAGGLSRIDEPAAERPRFVAYTTREGLSSNNVRCVTEDLAGRIYAGTVRGLDRLTPETGSVSHYGVSDGLAVDFVNCAFRDRNGALWFGTPNGLSRLDPHPDQAPAPPSISINGLRIRGVKQPVSEFGSAEIARLELGAAQNDLQIDFSSLSIGHASLLRYQYKLEGADSDWSVPTDQRTVNYPNLSPGSYRFLARAVTADGLVSASPAIMDFTILPPFWRQWWFIGLAATALALAAYSLYRYRVAQLIELERVRTRIATDLHDDIGSALSQIAILSEVARKRLSQTDAAAAAPLSRIAHLSRESVDTMSDIVWAINPLRDRLSDLTHRMRYFANEVLAGRDIEFRFEALDAEQDHKINAETRRQVFLIFKETITNIIRHSACTEVDIEFSNDRNRLVLSVHDNGCGFDPAAGWRGHGLASLRQRAGTLGGQLEVASSRGRGTTITLKAPLTN